MVSQKRRFQPLLQAIWILESLGINVRNSSDLLFRNFTRKELGSGSDRAVSTSRYELEPRWYMWRNNIQGLMSFVDYIKDVSLLIFCINEADIDFFFFFFYFWILLVFFVFSFKKFWMRVGLSSLKSRSTTNLSTNLNEDLCEVFIYYCL